MGAIQQMPQHIPRRGIPLPFGRSSLASAAAYRHRYMLSNAVGTAIQTCTPRTPVSALDNAPVFSPACQHHTPVHIAHLFTARLF